MRYHSFYSPSFSETFLARSECFTSCQIMHRLLLFIYFTYFQGWSCGYCFKEVVIQYKLEGTQPTPREILTRDTSWVSVVWNNARKRYRVFLKNVDTTQQTFRFYVFEDDALDTFIEKARSNMKLLQTDMLEHTHLDGLEFTVLLSTTKTWQIYDGSECLLDRVTRTPDQQQASLKSHGSIRQTETSSIDSGISFRSQRSVS